MPVFLSSVLDWKFWQAGGFMAAWVIGNGAVQASAPALLGRRFTFASALNAIVGGLILFGLFSPSTPPFTLIPQVIDVLSGFVCEHGR